MNKDIIQFFTVFKENGKRANLNPSNFLHRKNQGHMTIKCA